MRSLFKEVRAIVHAPELPATSRSPAGQVDVGYFDYVEADADTAVRLLVNVLARPVEVGGEQHDGQPVFLDRRRFRSAVAYNDAVQKLSREVG